MRTGNEKNELSREPQLSTIMLLEKKGKSTDFLNNLSPGSNPASAPLMCKGLAE